MSTFFHAFKRGIEENFSNAEEAKGVFQIDNFHRHPLMTLPLILQFQQ